MIHTMHGDQYYAGFLMVKNTILRPYEIMNIHTTNNYPGPDLCSKWSFFLEDRRAALSSLISDHWVGD